MLTGVNLRHNVAPVTRRSVQRMLAASVERASVHSPTEPKKRTMENKLKYVVPSIGTTDEVRDSALCGVGNPPSRVRKTVSDTEIQEALLRHCQTSHEQTEGHNQ